MYDYDAMYAIVFKWNNISNMDNQRFSNATFNFPSRKSIILGNHVGGYILFSWSPFSKATTRTGALGRCSTTTPRHTTSSPNSSANSLHPTTTTGLL